MGAPSKLTKQRRDAIIEARRLLLPKSQCAAAAGIHYDTLRAWLDRGETESAGKFYEFSRDFKRAEQEAQQELLQTIKAASRGPDGKWQAAAWILERTSPDDYGQRTVTQLQGQGGGAIKFVITPIDTGGKS